MKKHQYIVLFLLCASSANLLLESPKDAGVSFLYETFPGSCVRRVMRHSWFGTVTGWVADCGVSRHMINSFIKKYAINIDEIEEPIRSFKNLNHFFTRTLKKSARPIDQRAEAMCAPADGFISAYVDIKQDHPILIKKSHFNLKDFLKDEALAQEFEGGTLVVFRITPGDYHRFHMPVRGTVLPARLIHGKFESVNPLVYSVGVQPLIENERHLIPVQTEQGKKIVIVPVGAMCVGRIIETYTPLSFYEKGEELGYFGFGGSTVAVLFAKGTITLNPEIIAALPDQAELPIKMGQCFARIPFQNQ